MTDKSIVYKKCRPTATPTINTQEHIIMIIIIIRLQHLQTYAWMKKVQCRFSAAWPKWDGRHWSYLILDHLWHLTIKIKLVCPCKLVPNLKKFIKAFLYSGYLFSCFLFCCILYTFTRMGQRNGQPENIMPPNVGGTEALKTCIECVFFGLIIELWQALRST